MKERIDVTISAKVLDENEAKRMRLERTCRFEESDRTPVLVDMQLSALLSGRNAKFSDMLVSPRDHLRGLILNWKYRTETIRDDLPIEIDRLVVELDFGAIRGAEFPMEVKFQGGHPKTIHLLKAVEEIDHLVIPHPYSNHNKMRIDWFKEMRFAVEDFDLRLNGQRLDLEVNLDHWGGPFPAAFALCGANLFLWMATEPKRVHRLMEIVTESFINCITYLDDLKGVPHNHPVMLGADTAEMISKKFFQEFVIPYYRSIWDRYPRPWTLHMCGKIDHLLDVIRDELRIDSLDGFGFPTDRRKLESELAGRVILRGGPHPVLVHDGPVERIIAEGCDYLQTAGRHGGFILSEGFGIMPGTPAKHILALVEAAKRNSQ